MQRASRHRRKEDLKKATVETNNEILRDERYDELKDFITRSESSYCICKNFIDWPTERAEIKIQELVLHCKTLPDSSWAILKNPNEKRFFCLRAKRRTAFSNKTLKFVIHQINHRLQLLLGIDDEYKVSDLALLRSDPGCQQQWFHRDYFPVDTNGHKPSFSFIYSFMENTTIDIVTRECINKNASDFNPHDKLIYVYKRVTLPPDSLLVFRGDVIHAGSPYFDQEIPIGCAANYRLHGFLEHVNAKRLSDQNDWLTQGEYTAINSDFIDLYNTMN